MTQMEALKKDYPILIFIAIDNKSLVRVVHFALITTFPNKQTKNAINREMSFKRNKISVDRQTEKKNAHADDLFPLFYFILFYTLARPLWTCLFLHKKKKKGGGEGVRREGCCCCCCFPSGLIKSRNFFFVFFSFFFFFLRVCVMEAMTSFGTHPNDVECEKKKKMKGVVNFRVSFKILEFWR